MSKAAEFCRKKYPGAVHCYLFDKLTENEEIEDYVSGVKGKLFFVGIFSPFFVFLSNSNRHVLRIKFSIESDFLNLHLWVFFNKKH